MVVATLVVQAILQFLIAASCFFVGQTVRIRGTTTPEARLGARAFAAWWVGLGVYIAIRGVLALAAAVEFTPFSLFLAGRIVGIPFLAVAAWGIVTYVVAVYSGRVTVWRPVAVYAVSLAALFYVETFLDMDGTVTVQPWAAFVTTTNPSFVTLTQAYFALPLILSVLAYAWLARQTRGAEQRYRILVVSGGLLLWIVGGFVGESSGDSFLAFVTVSAVGFFTVATMIMAYRPPARVKEWLHERDARAVGRGR